MTINIFLSLICFIYFFIMSFHEKSKVKRYLEANYVVHTQAKEKFFFADYLNKIKSIGGAFKDLRSTGDTPMRASVILTALLTLHFVIIFSILQFFHFSLSISIVFSFASLLTLKLNVSIINKSRKKKADLYSTDVLAILNLLLYSGFSLENSFTIVIDDIMKIDKVCGLRFQLMKERIGIVGLEKALLEFSDLWNEKMLRRTFIGLSSFVTSGGSIASFVTSEIERISHETESLIEVKVAKISSKLTAPMVILIMFPSLGFMLAPAIAHAVSILSGFK